MSSEERRARIAELKSEIERLNAELVQLKTEDLWENSPLKMGDIIEWDYGHGKSLTKRRGRVVGGKEWLTNSLTLIAVVIKKDGSDGSQVDVYPYLNPRVVKDQI